MERSWWLCRVPDSLEAIGHKKIHSNTLLMHNINRSVNFNGRGILAHSTSGDKYTGSFTLNDTAISNNSTETKDLFGKNIKYYYRREAALYGRR